MRRFFLMYFLLLYPLSAHAETNSCKGLDLHLHSANPLPEAQVGAVCQGVSRAVEFLTQLGLGQRRTLNIEMVDHPLDTKGHPIYGSYESSGDRIRIMTQASIAQLPNPEMYDEPVDSAHYLGVVAHEVTHALVQQNTDLTQISNSAQEYLAHATQLATLPVERRQKIIERAGVGPWQVNDQISEIYMAFAPARFAVKCYLHLTGLGQPREFVRYLLSYKWRYITVT